MPLSTRTPGASGHRSASALPVVGVKPRAGLYARMRGHQSHQRLGRDVTDVPQHGDAIRARHGEIGEHQVEIVLIDERNAGFAVRCSMNLKALAFQ